MLAASARTRCQRRRGHPRGSRGPPHAAAARSIRSVRVRCIVLTSGDAEVALDPAAGGRIAALRVDGLDAARDRRAGPARLGLLPDGAVGRAPARRDPALARRGASLPGAPPPAARDPRDAPRDRLGRWSRPAPAPRRSPPTSGRPGRSAGARSTASRWVPTASARSRGPRRRPADAGDRRLAPLVPGGCCATRRARAVGEPVVVDLAAGGMLRRGAGRPARRRGGPADPARALGRLLRRRRGDSRRPLAGRAGGARSRATRRTGSSTPSARTASASSPRRGRRTASTPASTPSSSRGAARRRR